MEERSTPIVNDVIATNGAPAAIGPYSQAIKSGDLLFTAGQIPLDPSTMKVVDGGIEEQTERVMKNLEAVLAEGGSSFAGVVKTTCFLADLADFPKFNAIYATRFPNNPPARSTVQVAKLPMGVLVEVECIARTA
jgi:2-iminobutanoate/2-iminopropanoate deaminase